MRFRLYFFTIFVNIYFLLSKLERDSVITKLDQLHSQYTSIKIRAYFDIPSGDNNVIDATYHLQPLV